MDTGLQGKAVIVTGATANIGRAIALAFAAEGARVLVIGRDAEAGERVVGAALKLGSPDARFMSVDLREPDCGDRITAEAMTAFGTIDVLVNNVGGNAAMGLFAESDPATWMDDVDITFLTVLRVTRSVLPIMIAHKSGKIVNIGSTAGLVGDHMLAVYSAAKGAVHSFTKVLAKEVGRHGICVNCVAPYATMSSDPEAYSEGSRFHPVNGFFTQVVPRVDPAELAHLQRQGPLDRTVARPEEVASAALYLSSRHADFMTGEIVSVSGGVLL